MIEKLCMVIIFVGAAVGVGIYCRRTTGSVDGFVLGGRNVGPWMSAFAFGTSYFSAVIFVGYAGQFGWKYGIAATWIGIGNAILGSLLAWWVLGPRTREVTHRLGASTMPEFFGARYRSKGLRIAAAAIIFVFLIPYTASVYNGLSRLFGMAFGLPYEVCVIGMAVITCIYVVLGGYMATVMNDFIQGIVMLAGIVAVIVAVLANNGGFTEAITSLSLIPAEGSEMAGPFVSFFGPNLPDLIGVVILTSLGTWGLPQMVQKFYAIKSGPAIKQGAIISTVFAMVVAGGSYFLGGFGRLYGGQVEMTAAGAPVYDSIIPTMLSTLPDLLIGIVIVLVLSASMSHARAAGGVHRGVGGACACAVHVIHHVHRSAHEHLVGRAGGRVSGAVFLGAVLAARVARGRVGQLCRGRGLDDGEHDCRTCGHSAHRVAHQLRRPRHGAVVDRGTGGQPGDEARAVRGGSRAWRRGHRSRIRMRVGT